MRSRIFNTRGQALIETNLQLHHVVSDITGATGMRIIRAIVDGERDPEVPAAFRDVRCKCSMDKIKAALVGNDRDEHVFALTQSLELYDFYKVQIEACDRKLAKQSNDIQPFTNIGHLLKTKAGKRVIIFSWTVQHGKHRQGTNYASKVASAHEAEQPLAETSPSCDVIRCGKQVG